MGADSCTFQLLATSLSVLAFSLVIGSSGQAGRHLFLVQNTKPTWMGQVGFLLLYY